jgi:DNA adenine methylase
MANAAATWVDLSEAQTSPKPAVFLKWAGGKRQLLSHLLEHVPRKFGRYYEPFLGGGALFFALRAAGWTGPATLGDANVRLACTYAGVKDDVHRVIAGLREKKYTRECFKVEREYDVDIAPPWRVAVWLIYLNRTCFNGLYRVNRAGKFNVPFGRYTNPTICDAEGLHRASHALERTKIVADDFEHVVRDAKAGDVVYFDPPYVPVSASANFTGYTQDGFGDADQVHLRDVAVRLRLKGVHVILSNSDCPRVRELYTCKGISFRLQRVEARRNVNSKAGKRGPVGELIIT